MATITYDFLSPARFKAAGASSTYERFKKVWGTKWVDGIEVYDNRLYWYNGSSVRNDTAFNRFINKIGIKRAKLTNNNFHRVSNCYFNLNTSKYTYTPMDYAAIAQDLSSTFAVGDEFELAVSYGGDLKRFVTVHYKPKVQGGSTYTIDTDGIRAELNSDPLKYFANIATEAAGVQFQTLHHHEYTINVGTNKTKGSTPVTKIEYDTTNRDRIYEVLALLDNGSMFEQQGSVYTERINGVQTQDQYSNTAIIGEYSYLIKYKVIALPSVESYIVHQCSLVAQAVYGSLHSTKTDYYTLINHAIDTKIKEAVLKMDNPSSNPLFYQGYLRVDSAALMKRKDFVKMLSKCFDSGTTMQKAKWYERIIAIVIIIIAIVIIVLTWWTGVGNVAGGSMMALGLGMMYASAFLAISMILYANAFPYATDQITMIGSAATIIGYGAMIVGIYNLVNQSFINASLEAGRDAAAKAALSAYESGAATEAILTAAESAAANATSSFSTEMYIDSIVQSIKDSFISMGDSIASFSSGSLPNMSLGEASGWLKNINTSMSLYNQFFTAAPTAYIGSRDQSSKESTVEGYYAALSMTDNMDALDRMSMMKDNLLGGQQTLNILSVM